MSLIEKALNKTQSSHHSPDSGAQPQVPSPRRLLGPSGRSPRIGLMVTLGALLGLAVAGGWLIMDYWPPSRPQEQRKLSTREPLPNSNEAAGMIQDSVAREVHKTPRGPEQAQQFASGEPPEKSGATPGASLSGQKGYPTPYEPDPPIGGIKNPSFQRVQKDSSPSKPRHEVLSPRAAKGSRERREQKTGAEEKQRVLLEKAYIQAQAGQLQAALEIYDQVLAREPQQPEALVNRGVLRMRMGDLPGAKRDLLEAKRLKPQDSTLLNALGVLHLQTGELEAAAQYFRSSPEPASFVNLALVYWRKGSPQRALEILGEAQERIPQDPWLAYYKALLLGELGKQKQAREELERARGLALKRGDIELMHRVEAAQSGP